MDSLNVHAIFRPNQPGLKKVLGDLEAEIMETIWAEGRPVLGKDIHAKLPTGKDLSYSTIVCTMTALAKKGLLILVAKEGKAHIYKPAYTREDFLHAALGHVLDNILEAFPDTAVALLNQRTQEEQTLTGLQQLSHRLEALDLGGAP